MYNPRFPHTMVVKRVKRVNGEIVYDVNGDVTYDVVPLAIVDMLDGSPCFNADGTFSTTTAESVNFGYRTSSKNTNTRADVVSCDFKLGCQMFLTELKYDDLLVMTDYDRTFLARLVKKTTYNWGTTVWVDEVKD